MIYIGQKSYRLYKSIEDKNIDEPVFKCDELLAPTIQILNLFGFKTTYCCSGHLVDNEYDTEAMKDYPIKVSNNDCYIVFEKSVEELRSEGFIPVSEAIPMSDAESAIMKQFKFENEHGVAVLRRTFPEDGARLFHMVNSALVLVRWAARLMPDSDKLKSIVNEFIVEKHHDTDWGLFKYEK